MREKHAAVHMLDSRLRGNDGEEREQVVNGYFPYTSSSLYNPVNGYGVSNSHPRSHLPHVPLSPPIAPSEEIIPEDRPLRPFLPRKVTVLSSATTERGPPE